MKPSWGRCSSILTDICSLFHRSFGEWLNETETRYCATVEDGTASLAEKCLSLWNDFKDYSQLLEKNSEEDLPVNYLYRCGSFDESEALSYLSFLFLYTEELLRKSERFCSKPQHAKLMVDKEFWKNGRRAAGMLINRLYH